MPRKRPSAFQLIVLVFV